MSNGIEISIKNVADIAASRITKTNHNPIYDFSKKETDILLKELNDHKFISSNSYKNIRTGTLCARELEGIDDEFCDAVYDMMSIIKKSL